MSTLDVYDNGNGSVQLQWRPIPGAVTYNFYLNGVLQGNTAGLVATISGLTQTSYSVSAIAPTPNNSARPQNMPPNGVVTPSGTYDIKVVGVNGGSVEIGPTQDVIFTVSPTSIMLRTPMKRLWPFPNTGLD